MTQLRKDISNIGLKDLIVYILAIVCMASGLTAIFIGLYMDPQGEIHTSLLTFYGLSLAYSGSLLGFSIHFGSKSVS